MVIITQMRASYTKPYHLTIVVRIIRFSYWSIGVYGLGGGGGGGGGVTGREEGYRVYPF